MIKPENKTKNVSRRQFLKAGAVLSGLSTTASLALTTKSKAPALLSAVSDRKGNHYGAILSDSGHILHLEPFDNRCHASVYNKHYQQGVFFSRRPGDKIYVVNMANKQRYTVKADVGHHFYGHGVTSMDQRFLFATENAYESGKGVISIRDFEKHLSVVKKMPSYGIGPHELALMPDGKTLVIANGGLRTHPDKRRIPQNIEQMQPNISFVDWQSGKLLAQFFPSDHLMGLRHLSVSSEGRVVVGVQYKGAQFQQVPLVLEVTQDKGIHAMTSPEHFAQKHKQYTASVCAVGNDYAFVSCPKANQLTLWGNQGFLTETNIKDVAGVCHHEGKVFFSTGTGQIGRCVIRQGQFFHNTIAQYSDFKWDNHLVAV